jgi:hypothetical protein
VDSIAGGLAVAFIGALVVVQILGGDALGRLKVTS